jgi:hypothetical protein
VGFEAPQKAYRLNFAETDLAGLEVTAGSLPLGEFLKVSELAATKDDPQGAAASAAQLFATFAGSLMSWNLTRDGEPVPATYEGILGQDLDFMMKIVLAWVSAMADVDTPLLNGSNSGADSALEHSIPMAAHSPSHQS